RNAGRLEDAEKAFAAALALHKQLTTDFPIRAKFRIGLATTEYNLAALLVDTGRLKEAEDANAAALTLFGRLAADSATGVEGSHGLAECQANVGRLCRATGL